MDGVYWGTYKRVGFDSIVEEHHSWICVSSFTLTSVKRSLVSITEKVTWTLYQLTDESARFSVISSSIIPPLLIDKWMAKVVFVTFFLLKSYPRDTATGFFFGFSTVFQEDLPILHRPYKKKEYRAGFWVIQTHGGHEYCASDRSCCRKNWKCNRHVAACLVDPSVHFQMKPHHQQENASDKVDLLLMLERN